MPSAHTKTAVRQRGRCKNSDARSLFQKDLIHGRQELRVSGDSAPNARPEMSVRDITVFITSITKL